MRMLPERGRSSLAIARSSVVFPDPFAPMIPLAHLGLARARAAAGDREGARRAYHAVLAMWQKADDDFPPRRTAKAEYDGLAPPPGVSTQP